MNTEIFMGKCYDVCNLLSNDSEKNMHTRGVERVFGGEKEGGTNGTKC